MQVLERTQAPQEDDTSNPPKDWSDKTASPLRYPGGKWRIAPFLRRLLLLNDFQTPRYVEPYAGGASLALSLLFSNTVANVRLNDLDPAIYSFWWCVLRRPKEILQFIDHVPLTLKEWRRQRDVYQQGARGGRLRLGLATFYLNRTNHSGIMNGGVIGGQDQHGEWKIGARFNRADLRLRVERVLSHQSRIEISNQDAIAFLKTLRPSSNSFVYLDPPYFRPGKALYLNAYDPRDHRDVRDAVVQLRSPWMISYDNVPAIRKLYHGNSCRRLTILHTARSLRVGNEVIYFSREMKIPRVPQAGAA